MSGRLLVGSMSAALLFLVAESATAQGALPAGGVPRLEAEPIVITGQRPKEKAAIATGSRLRETEPLADYRGFVSQVATSTGVAGLTPQSGMDPFAGPTVRRTVKLCLSSDKRLSQRAICDLAKAKTAIAANDLALAKQRLHQLLEGTTANGADRFVAHRFLYDIALREADERDQFDALAGMVESGLLSDADRILALKTQAALAMRAGNDGAAIGLLERVVHEAPGERKAQANLGVLYAKAGLHDRARARLAEAVRLSQQANAAVPAEWTAYLQR